ncbi:MAG: non-ribosomal peptide synthetase, partial [Hyphomicrobiaceae bacterium]
QEPPMSFGLPEAQVTVMPLRNFGAMYDLHTFMWDDGDRIGGLLTYNSGLFDDDFVTRFLSTLETAASRLIGSPAEQICRVPMLCAPDQQLLDNVNRTKSDFPHDASVVDLFAARVNDYADKTAVTGVDSILSYAELDASSTAFAAYLQSRGVERGDLVGIGVDRSARMLVALLGIWKAGAAYVPLDPEYPNERLSYMMQTAAIRLLVTQASLGSRMPDYDCQRVLLDAEWDDIIATEAKSPMSPSAGEDLAYVIFTSGSTGQPKGVQVPHRAVVNFLQSMAEQPGISADDSLLAVTTLSFDIAVLELYLPICNGATTYIATAEQAGNGRDLLQLIKDRTISIMQATPSTWRLLIADGWLDEGEWSDFKVLCGGEAFPADLAHALTAKIDNVWNMYGPTETTVWSAIKKLDRSDTDVRIGKPIQNTDLHILNEAGMPVPVGVPGGLHVSGSGITAGYLGRQDLPDASFFSHQLDPKLTIYATGDLVKLHPDGDLEFLQRLDSQIKLRGFRIELGEIESVLSATDGVAEVVANVWAGSGSDKRLVAYVKPDGSKVNVIQLRKALRTRLPDYMIPQHFVEVDGFPTTANGKIDRKALPSPLGLERNIDKKPPETDIEKSVATIWSDVLGEARIARDDHFFDIGGHSLLAANVIFRIEKKYGVRLNPRMIVMHSLAEIAAGLDSSDLGEVETA